MSRRPPSRPPSRSVVRISQRSHSDQHALIRAYELGLPVVRKTLADAGTNPSSASAKRRCPPSPILLGA
jgi:hypothetical protein